MDYYKKNKVKNFILFVIFAIGVYLQFYGHSIESKTGLMIQFLSLLLILTVLFLYNRRHK